MSAAQLAVLVLARTFRDTDTRAAAAITAIEDRTERTFRTIATFRTGWELGTEGVAPAMACFALGAGEAKAVGVRIVLTVHEPNAAVSTATGACLTFLGQGSPWNCGSQGCACYGTGNSAYRHTAADLLVSQSFGYVFEPISHSSSPNLNSRHITNMPSCGVPQYIEPIKKER